MARSSIYKKLLVWLLIPLCLLCVATTVMAFNIAKRFSNEAYDGQLVKSAAAVAARLHYDGSRVSVDLPPAAQAVLRYNKLDKFYFQVVDLKGVRISGDAILPKPAFDLDSDKPVFRYSVLANLPIRIARIRVLPPHGYDHPVFIQVAETLNCRTAFRRQILLAILIPQIVLVLLGLWAVALGISQGLAPLRRLEKAISRRTKLDLTPVEESEAPVEVYPLIVAINDLIERLRDDIESQQRFVANAAHQFRTPIAGFQTYIGLAQRICRDDSLRAILCQLNSGCERLANLVVKMLTLARIEPAGAQRQIARLDLNFVASQACSELIAEAIERNVELIFEDSPAPAFINGEQSALLDLVSNIVENALRYSSAGGEVRVKVFQEADVVLQVDDTGPGIPEDERERVFERFYRILGNEAPGSGLGLAIVREIANAHNALISLSSGPQNCGTSFVVRFPRA